MTPYYEDTASGITIYHGDARSLLPGTFSAQALITDPPYPGREDLFPTNAVGHVITNTKHLPGFVFWPCMGMQPTNRMVDAVHIWHKAIPIHRGSVTGNIAGHHYERILSYGLGKRCEVFRIAAVLPNFEACRKEITEHPTQKPLDLMWQLVNRTEGTVLDPFAGSGSTLLAARQCGRRAIGIEIEERYCEIAAKRLAQGVLDFGAAS